MIFRGVMAMSLLLAAVVASAAEKLPAGVVAKMGEVELKTEELRMMVDGLPPEARAQVAAQPQEMLNRLIRTEVLRRALAAEARSKGWDRRPDVIAQMERAREQMLVSSYMNSVARPPESFPSDAEVKAAYDQNPASFAVPKQYRLGQIFVLAPPESDKAAFQKAQAKVTDLVSKARAKGADFAALAKANSDHSESAAKGGDMGWVAEANLLPELRESVSTLKKGETSAAIRSPQGWHIVRLEDSRDRSVKPLPEVKEQIAGALRARKAQETEQAYLTFMTNKTPVNLNDAELAKLQGSIK